jgi:hypothetical protein
MRSIQGRFVPVEREMEKSFEHTNSLNLPPLRCRRIVIGGRLERMSLVIDCFAYHFGSTFEGEVFSTKMPAGLEARRSVAAHLH